CVRGRIGLLNLVGDSGEVLVDVVLHEFAHHVVNLFAVQGGRCYELGVGHGGGVARESLVGGAGGKDGGGLGGAGGLDVAGACAAVVHRVGGHDGGFPFLWFVGGFGCTRSWLRGVLRLVRGPGRRSRTDRRGRCPNWR